MLTVRKYGYVPILDGIDGNNAAFSTLHATCGKYADGATPHANNGKHEDVPTLHATSEKSADVVTLHAAVGSVEMFSPCLPSVENWEMFPSETYDPDHPQMEPDAVYSHGASDA